MTFPQRRHALLFVAGAVLAILLWAVFVRGPRTHVEHLHARLRTTCQLEELVGEPRWFPSRGAWADLLRGRGLLVLGRTAGVHSLCFVSLRLTPAGTVAGTVRHEAIAVVESGRPPSLVETDEGHVGFWVQERSLLVELDLSSALPFRRRWLRPGIRSDWAAARTASVLPAREAAVTEPALKETRSEASLVLHSDFRFLRAVALGSFVTPEESRFGGLTDLLVAWEVPGAEVKLAEKARSGTLSMCISAERDLLLAWSVGPTAAEFAVPCDSVRSWPSDGFLLVGPDGYRLGHPAMTLAHTPEEGGARRWAGLRARRPGAAPPFLTLLPLADAPVADSASADAFAHGTVERLGALVRVTRVFMPRLSVEALPAEREFIGARVRPTGQAATSGRLAMSLGVRSYLKPKGLFWNARVVQPFAEDAMGLVVDGRSVAMFNGRKEWPSLAAVIELTPVAREAVLVPRAVRARGSMRARGALCIEGDTLWIAETQFDSDEATGKVLLDLGCREVVALERGSQHPFWLETAATQGPFETSALIFGDGPPERRPALPDWLMGGADPSP